MLARAALVALSVALLHCTVDASDAVVTDEGALKGCHGKASSVQPSTGDYYLTTFGVDRSDDGIMSCGTYTKHGSWYYAASRQRFGCGAHIRITARGKCVVARTDDYGPDVCVENAAGRPIIDASPLVAKALFDTSSAGYSDHLSIHVEKVSPSTPLGPCSLAGEGDACTVDGDCASGACDTSGGAGVCR